ncbi:MAG: ankyrin repeat domain-containing protein [Terracidiphilus sp.]|jgi:ankyrin repeat protein
MKPFPFFSQFSFSRILRPAGVVLVALTWSSLAFCGPIHDAALKGDLKKVQALIQSDPKVVSEKDKMGDTALHVAALHGQIAVAQALLDAGADVNAKNNYGPFTPGDLWPLIYANGHPDPVALLKVHGVDQRDMKNGYTPLDLAEFSVKHFPMVQLLVSKGADVNAQASSGATPLFWAIMRDQKDDATFLLDHGANVNATDAYGDSILGIALNLQYGSLIQLIVDRGADVNALDQSGHRPLTFALGMDDRRWADLLKKHGAHE